METGQAVRNLDTVVSYDPAHRLSPNETPCFFILLVLPLLYRVETCIISKAWYVCKGCGDWSAKYGAIAKILSYCASSLGKFSVLC